MILIVSGTQFLINNRIVNAEHWTREEIKRLSSLITDLLGEENSGKVLFLSGDVHHA